MRIMLNGKWQFKQTDKNDWMDATVPGCNYLDLMDNEIISDPFKGMNENDVQWVGEKDWEYRRFFDITESDFECSRIVLNCEMLDTVCDIYINDCLLGKSENCFLKYSNNIYSYLHTGKNEIRIVFHSPVVYVREKYKACPTPVNSNGMNGICHIRKPQCHFGWDWGPVLPSSGITGDIYIDFIKYHSLNFVKVNQFYKGGKVKIKVQANVSKYSSKKYICEISLVSPDGTTVTQTGTNVRFFIDNPELWWTKELSGKSKQPLYKIITVLRLDNGERLDRQVKKIGLRMIELRRTNDKYGQNFKFYLNRVPLFIKGANYIPPDSFITRFNKDKLNYLLDAVQFSNINMLRIWGGGYYGSDEFYEACDERGILVWQDFQFACMAYPFFDCEFLENVKKEVRYNVGRLSHHPSLAVWCGNNEIEDMHMAWAHMQKYVDYTEKFFYEMLEPEVRRFNTFVQYIPGSPIGISHNNGVHSDNVGDTHLWGVWHGLQPMNHYRRHMTRFCSEFGFESLPDMKTIETFAAPSDYSLSSAVFKAHQKCDNGNDKMVYYIASRFNLPKKFKDYVYLSQVTQQECIADATEHWRRHRGRCNGAMYWQLNDCWSVCSWSSIDYFGNYKALQYKARYFNAPLSVSIEDTKEYIRIFVINDLTVNKYVDIEYELFDFETGTLFKKKRFIESKALRYQKVFSLDVETLKKKFNTKRIGLCARLYENGEELMQKTVLFDSEKNLDLPKAKLKCRITLEEDRLKLDISSDKYARFVKVESSKSVLPFSDNFFDLLPGQSKTVTMNKDKSMSLKEQAESITAYSLCNIEPSGDALDTKMKQFKVFLSPVNLANAFYHGKPSKDTKVQGRKEIRFV